MDNFLLADGSKNPGGNAMKWSEMSLIQKMLFVAGWISVAVWLVLTILDENGVVKATAARHALYAIWCVGAGCTQKKRWLRVLWYVLAGMWFALCLRALF